MTAPHTLSLYLLPSTLLQLSANLSLAVPPFLTAVEAEYRDALEQLIQKKPLKLFLGTLSPLRGLISAPITETHTARIQELSKNGIEVYCAWTEKENQTEHLQEIASWSASLCVMSLCHPYSWSNAPTPIHYRPTLRETALREEIAAMQKTLYPHFSGIVLTLADPFFSPFQPSWLSAAGLTLPPLSKIVVPLYKSAYWHEWQEIEPTINVTEIPSKSITPMVNLGRLHWGEGFWPSFPTKILQDLWAINPSQTFGSPLFRLRNIPKNDTLFALFFKLTHRFFESPAPLQTIWKEISLGSVWEEIPWKMLEETQEILSLYGILRYQDACRESSSSKILEQVEVIVAAINKLEPQIKALSAPFATLWSFFKIDIRRLLIIHLQERRIAIPGSLNIDEGEETFWTKISRENSGHFNASGASMLSRIGMPIFFKEPQYKNSLTIEHPQFIEDAFGSIHLSCTNTVTPHVAYLS